MENKLASIKTRLESIRAEAGAMLDSGNDGRSIVKIISSRVDYLLVEMWEAALAKVHSKVNIDVIAVGGYGRAELCPYSDWDLLFLVEDVDSPETKDCIESFLYVLWDCNIPLGYAVRTVKESKSHCKEDIHAKTALLESRLLYGNGTLYEQLHLFSHEFWGKGERLTFCQQKIDELCQRRKNSGGTPFLMEPNIKEGQGGLRDVSTIFWLSMAWYGVPTARHLIEKGIVDEAEFETFIEARNFLLKVRAALHIQASREQDVLRFDDQVYIANRLSYEDRKGRREVEAFMKDYFGRIRIISDMTDIFILHFEECMHPKRFARKKSLNHGMMINGDSLTIEDEHEFLSDPLNLLRVFVESQREHRYLDSRAMRLIRGNADIIDTSIRANRAANELFMEILRAPRNVATAFKQMHETGVLGQFVPDFERIIGHGQFDRYHVYTVDAHTIRAIDTLRDILLVEKQFIDFPKASKVMKNIERPEILYLAILFHDIAKGRGGDHSELGEVIALNECQRFGLDEESSRFVAWLVRQHLMMAKTSQRYDLSDTGVIDDFSHKVEDVQHLNHLFLLTIADVSSVGPDIWTSWKEQLLLELYGAARDNLQSGQVHTDGRLRRAKTRKEAVVKKFSDDKVQPVKQLLDSMPVSCLLHFSSEQLNLLAEVMTQDEEGVSFDVDHVHKHTRFYIWAHDRSGFFSRLAAALSMLKIRVLTAQAFNLNNNRVIDEFLIVDMNHNPVIEISDLEKIKKRLLKVIAGEDLDVSVETDTSKLDIMARELPVVVRQLDRASSNVTAIQVSAAGRPGLLAKLSMTIHGCGLDMQGANVSTFGEKVIDVFFVTEGNGDKLSEQRINEVIQALEEAACVK